MRCLVQVSILLMRSCRRSQGRRRKSILKKSGHGIEAIIRVTKFNDKQCYYLGRRQSHVTIEPIDDQFEKAEEELMTTRDEELAHAIVTNYFPEGIDPAYLTDEFYEGFGQ